MNSRIVLLLGLTIFAGCNSDPEVAKKRYLESGNKYFEKGQFKQAQLMYKKAIDKDKKYGEGYYRLALADLRLGELSNAAASLHRAVDLTPTNIDAHAKLIDLYLAAYAQDPKKPPQYLTEVRSVADRLLKKDPRSYDGLRVQGYLALADKDVKTALLRFQEADRVKPGQPELAVAIVQAMAANGQVEEAQRYARQYIASNKKFPRMYDILYLDLIRRNQVEAAEGVMKDKLANLPDQVEHHLEMAAHYARIGKKQDMQNVLQGIAADPKRFPQGRQQVGDFYLAVRDFDQAHQQYQAGLKAAANVEDRGSYRQKIAEAYVIQDKRPEAEKMVQELLKEDPKDPEGIAMRAGFAVASNDRARVPAAIEDLEGLVTRFPQNAVVRFNLGRALLIKGGVENEDRARLAFEDSIKVNRNFLPPRLALAQFHAAKREWAKSLQQVDEVLQVQPVNVPARLLRTSALVQMGDAKQARLELDELLKQAPALVDAQFQLAALNAFEKRYSDAEPIFRRLREANDARGTVGLVEIMVAQRQYPQALAILDEELRKQPQRAELHLAKANTLALAQRYDEALAEYKLLLDKNPDAVDLHLRVGQTHRLKGDPESALTSFRKAAQVAPNNVVPHLELAQTLDSVGRKDEAKPAYEQALKIEADNPIACNNLAFLLADTGKDLDNALNLAQRARQKLPKNPLVTDTLGYVYIKKQLSEPAIALYEEILVQNPDNPVFRYHLAMAFAQKGDKAKAKRELETALKQNPAKDVQGQIRQLLSEVS